MNDPTTAPLRHLRQPTRRGRSGSSDGWPVPMGPAGRLPSGTPPQASLCLPWRPLWRIVTLRPDLIPELMKALESAQRG